MRENDLTVKAAILATDLELLGVNLEHLQSRVSLFDQFDCVFKLLLRGHCCGCQNNYFGWVVGENIEQFLGCWGVYVLTESSRFVDKHNNILLVEFANID